jgi:putative transcriptional regulator
VTSLLRRAVLLAAVAALAGAANATGAQDSPQKREAVMLVAKPGMIDPRFAETVVLVAFPPDAGPMGVVLNRPSPLDLRSIWPERKDRQGRVELIHFGGPLQPDGLLFVFRMTPPPEKALWVTGNIYLSGDGDILERLLALPEPPADQRFYAGYAGWVEGQLEHEIELGGWYVLPPDAEVIFEMNALEMWERMLQRATLPRT